MTMAEYIDRRAVLSDIQLLAKYYNGEMQKCILTAYEVIKNRPFTDAAEVVRCKDCVNYTYFDAYKGRMLNFHFCKKFYNITLESDFCSYGEKKDGKVGDKP